MKVRRLFILLSVSISLALIIISLFWKPILWAFVVVGPLILMDVIDIFQTKHAIRKNFPVIGRLRYFFESFRPEIMQYFVENDREGRPLDRVMGRVGYQRENKGGK